MLYNISIGKGYRMITREDWQLFISSTKEHYKSIEQIYLTNIFINEHVDVFVPADTDETNVKLTVEEIINEMLDSGFGTQADIAFLKMNTLLEMGFSGNTLIIIDKDDKSVLRYEFSPILTLELFSGTDKINVIHSGA